MKPPFMDLATHEAVRVISGVHLGLPLIAATITQDSGWTEFQVEHPASRAETEKLIVVSLAGSLWRRLRPQGTDLNGIVQDDLAMAEHLARAFPIGQRDACLEALREDARKIIVASWARLAILEVALAFTHKSVLLATEVQRILQGAKQTYWCNQHG